ncbi:hypothetical protein Alches_12090 [Alicyclobacillus hesperidum subsp. aegles]|uniref:hypothetical protein n=1 Tax=Alicyclobacillus hesperidum TaxID=89784 RepID=UPI0007190ED8|nr:hypothetical protein [Alicyclobacillus hesperidum]KRW92466.1 hypothetical protein SD51_02880 [Alicyclobacillus tengchongensis]GLG01170.1 hypothetical protein Alches_12090 [Alicyclobacillus hesperidum subsp. aegles]
MSVCKSSATTVRFKLVWHDSELAHLTTYLNAYFERTADWTNAVQDMPLEYKRDRPYARLVANGDFYVEAGWRIDHFALDCGGQPVLIAVDDEGNRSYYPLP